MGSDHQPERKHRITVDRLFAPAPHDLITDPRISPAAFRLWCVLHMMAWLREQPDVERLQDRMDRDDPPNRRSIYRWLGELEAAGWLEWQRSPGRAGVSDRFALKTNAEPPEPVTPESQPGEPVTPESQPVTPESQPVILRSQAPLFYPLPEQAKHATQNHENHEDHVGVGDRARARKKIAPPHVIELARRGMTAAPEFAHLDPDAAITDFDNRIADGMPIGTIVEQWRICPPTPGAIYERRSIQFESAPRRPGRSAVATPNPERDAEYKRLIAEAERRAAERGP